MPSYGHYNTPIIKNEKLRIKFHIRLPPVVTRVHVQVQHQEYGKSLSFILFLMQK